MEQDKIIEVKNLTAGYKDFTLFDDISFDVNAGEIFAILGGSGCGKSTLLKQMTGLLKPTKGTINIQGKDIASASLNAKLEILRGLGVAFQSGALFGSMTIKSVKGDQGD